jgi:hypothetical protein
MFHIAHVQMSEKSGTNGNFIIYSICSVCSPHVCANFSQHIGIDSSAAVCNSLHKVTKISDFNSIHHP